MTASSPAPIARLSLDAIETCVDIAAAVVDTLTAAGYTVTAAPTGGYWANRAVSLQLLDTEAGAWVACLWHAVRNGTVSV